MKIWKIAVALGAVALLPFLGGSMIWYIGGAHGLDIDGHAAATDRPAASIGVGAGWPAYGGDAGGNRYSDASEITIENGTDLSLAWQFRTGDLDDNAVPMDSAATEGTPILVEDALIFCTSFNEVIALDPGNGTELWRFDSGADLNQRPANQFVCRGVSHWLAPDSNAECASRIFMGTNDA
jgi:quinoprotein glucose dehydrogenase